MSQQHLDVVLQGLPPEFPRRALTLWQPWAWLIAHGHKPIENRPPSFSHKSFRGWFWIHAGLREDKVEYDLARRFAVEHGFVGEWPGFQDLPYGAIVGRARIVDLLPPAKLEEEFRAGSWRMQGKIGLVLRDATPLATPVFCRGYQGFWTVPTAELEELKKAA